MNLMRRESKDRITTTTVVLIAFYSAFAKICFMNEKNDCDK
jgi:hypothetical protein